MASHILYVGKPHIITSFLLLVVTNNKAVVSFQSML